MELLPAFLEPRFRGEDQDSIPAEVGKPCGVQTLLQKRGAFGLEGGNLLSESRKIGPRGDVGAKRNISQCPENGSFKKALREPPCEFSIGDVRPTLL